MSPCQFIYHKGRPRDILASRDLLFRHHGQRGLLFDLHQMSIDKSTLQERLDASWRTVSENTAEMSSTGEMTFLFEVCGIEGRSGQTGIPQGAGYVFDFQIWNGGSEWPQSRLKYLVNCSLFCLLARRLFFYPDKGSNAETYISVGLVFLFCLVTLRASSLNKGTCL